MNIQKLEKAITAVKRDLGDSLIATNIFCTAEGKSLAGLNAEARSCDFCNEVTSNLNKSLIAADFAGLDKYYILSLKDGSIMIVIYLIKYQWGFLVDSKTVKMGLLLNLVIPNAVDAFVDALEM